MPKLRDSVRRTLVEERQAQILSAAAQVFSQKGFERATIADIAKKAGVAEGSIYNYFKNKADLLVSLPHQMIQPSLESIRSELFQADGKEPPPPEVMLRTMARTFVTVFRQNAPLFRVLLSALPSMKPAMREKYLEQVVIYVLSVLETYFQEQIAGGVFRSELNPHITARSFVGMFFPSVLLQHVLEVESPTDIDYEAVIENNVQIFLNGALAERGKRKAK